MQPSEAIADSVARADLLSETARTTLFAYYDNYRRAGEAGGQYYLATTARTYDEILDYLDSSPDTRLLDVGIGCGSEAIAFSHRCAHVTGIDIHDRRLACAQERLERLYPGQIGRLAIEKAGILEFDREPFDAIWINQAFHHLEPRADVMRRLTALLKPGGRLFFGEANALNPLLQASLFRQRGFKTLVTRTGPDGRTIAYGNERVLSMNRLIRHCAEHGLSVVSRRYFRCLPNKQAFAAAERILNGLRLPPFVWTHYNLVVEKTP